MPFMQKHAPMTERIRPPLSHPWAAAIAAALLAVTAGCARPPGADASRAPHAAVDTPAPAPSGELASWVDKPGWTAQRDMIAAPLPLAAQAGEEMLKAGGTAIDAAIAAQMVLTLIEPQASGIGGGAFLLHSDGKTLEAYDGRETAPAAAAATANANATARGSRRHTPGGIPPVSGPSEAGEHAGPADLGGRAVGVPGVLRMLELAHRTHGKLPWRRLLQPAIRLAEHGFPLGPRLAAAIAGDPSLANDPAARAYFFDKNGKPLPAGTTLKNPALAATLRLVAAHGANAFYTGAIARDIAAKVRQAPNSGGLTMQDLARYRAKVRAPLCTDYRKWTVCGMPPPSAGGLVVAQMLGMFETLPDWLQIGAQKPVRSASGYEPTPFAVHLFSEAGRLAYADRAQYVADPDFVAPPALGWSSLVDKRYVAARAHMIGDASIGHADAGSPSGAPLAFADDLGTEEPPPASPIVAVDRYGNALAMTSSVGGRFGSRLMVRGMLLNNTLANFSPASGEGGKPVANRMQPGKRARSTLAPVLVFEKRTQRLMMALGSAGGASAANYVAKTLIGMTDWGMTVQQAIALPNFDSRNGPTELEQARVPDALAQALRERGHDVRFVDTRSGLLGIQRINVGGQSVWFGGADPRQDGIVMGD